MFRPQHSPAGSPPPSQQSSAASSPQIPSAGSEGPSSQSTVKRPRGRPRGSTNKNKARDSTAAPNSVPASPADIGAASAAANAPPAPTADGESSPNLDPSSLDAAAAAAAGAAAAAATVANVGAGNNEEDGGDDYDDAEVQLLQGPSTTEEDREAVHALLETFDEDQLQRYEAYRRAHLPKAAIRKLVQTIIGGVVPPSAAIVVAGCGKLFVGELVEKALEVKEEQGEPSNTPLRPDHLREAFRRMRSADPSFLAGPASRRRRLFA